MADDHFEEQRAAWLAEMRRRGHDPFMNDYDGKLNVFVLSRGYHNGPGCRTCGWSVCWHCRDIKSIPDCSPLDRLNAQQESPK